jgi:hypothetical protein
MIEAITLLSNRYSKYHHPIMPGFELIAVTFR